MTPSEWLVRTCMLTPLLFDKMNAEFGGVDVTIEHGRD
jgi:hypothetical protein